MCCALLALHTLPNPRRPKRRLRAGLPGQPAGGCQTCERLQDMRLACPAIPNAGCARSWSTCCWGSRSATSSSSASQHRRCVGLPWGDVDCGALECFTPCGSSPLGSSAPWPGAWASTGCRVPPRSARLASGRPADGADTSLVGGRPRLVVECCAGAVPVLTI